MLARRIVLVDALTAVRRICACLCLYLYNVCLCLCLCLRLSWYMCAHICPAALHMACTNGQIKVVEALMAKNIPADPLDKYCLCLTQTWTRHRHTNLLSIARVVALCISLYFLCVRVCLSLRWFLVVCIRGSLFTQIYAYTCVSVDRFTHLFYAFKKKTSL